MAKLSCVEAVAVCNDTVNYNTEFYVLIGAIVIACIVALIIFFRRRRR